jgi:hypothetical protein
MTDVGSRLRDADPLAHEGSLSPADAQAIRHQMVATAAEADTRLTAWQPTLIAVAVVVTLAATASLARWRSGPSRPSASPDGGLTASDPLAGQSPVRRQLQFATPGGTRVIWVFDSRFEP